MSTRSKGYTLLETVIALAIIGLITVVVAAGSGRDIRAQRFSSEVNQFADNLKLAKTQSFTTQTAACGGCYWRGTEVEIDNSTTATTYQYNYLYGLTSYKLGDGGQSSGVTTEVPVKTYPLNSLKISGITYSGQGTQPSSVALAYFAPDGTVYTAPNKNLAWPDHATIKITLTTPGATNLSGVVTIDGASGTISTSIK